MTLLAQYVDMIAKKLVYRHQGSIYHKYYHNELHESQFYYCVKNYRQS